jgi:hypothetical protein
VLDTPVGTQLDLDTVSDTPVLLRRELAYAGSWPTRESACLAMDADAARPSREATVEQMRQRDPGRRCSFRIEHE